MKLAMSRTRELYPLSIKKVLKKTVASTFALIIMGLIIVSVLFGVLPSGVLPAGIGGMVTFTIFFLIALVVLIAYLYQRWYYAVYFYDLTSDYIVIKKGPITPHEITIPYERIQDVYVDQDLLDRMLGLYDVHLSSATISSGMVAHIDGVEKAAADGLRAELLKTIQQRISRNRNPQIQSQA